MRGQRAPLPLREGQFQTAFGDFGLVFPDFHTFWISLYHFVPAVNRQTSRCPQGVLETSKRCKNSHLVHQTL